MSNPQTIKEIIGLLVSDPDFREAFSRDPKEALLARRLEVSEDELRVLTKPLDDSTIGPASEVLDDRIKRRSDDLI